MTDLPVYLMILSSPQPPFEHIRRKIERGIPLNCGFNFKWRNTTCTIQNEANPTYIHTFYISPGSPPAGLYFFITDDCAWDIATWTSPMFWSGDWVGPSAPQPFTGAESTGQPALLINRGAKYVWWANDDWYAVLPHTTQLAICKRNGGLWTRLDPAGEPTPGADTFASAASALSLDGTTIHVAYLINRVSPAQRPVYWTTFNTITGLWGSFELVALTNNTTSNGDLVTVEEIPSGWPAVCYSNPDLTLGRAFYIDRATGVWGSPELIGTRTLRALYPSGSVIDPLTYDIHIMTAHSLNRAFHRKRSLSGVWSTQFLLPGTTYNGDHNSICHDGTTPAVGRLNPSNQASIVSGDPPTAEENGLTTAGVLPQTLLSSLAYPDTRWFFVRPGGAFANYYYRFGPGPLLGPITYAAISINRSAATLNGQKYAGVIMSAGVPYTASIAGLELITP